MTLTPLWIVTLNWNLREDTIACVESLLDAGAALSRVIVVDNGSTDGSPRAFAAHFGPELSLICNESNLGFASGMNVGIRYALAHGAESVLLLNNDTLVAPTMIEALIDAEIPLLPENRDAALRRPTGAGAQDAALRRPTGAGAQDTAGILGPAIYYHSDPDRLWKLGDVEHPWLPMPLSVQPKGSRQPDRQGRGGLAPFQVDYVTGCCMLVRRQVFERIGLFDSRYFMYFEDADFCRRARDADFAVWCVPKAKMWHKVSLSARRDRPLNRYHRALGQVRFYREHPHGPSAALRAAYIALKMARTMLGDVWRRDWDLIVPLWRGTIDGYREGM